LHIRALLRGDGLTDAGDLPVDPWGIGIDGSGPLYLRFHESANVKDFVSKAIPFLRKRLKGGEGHLERDYEVYLQPIQNIHLDPWIFADFTQKGNVVYVYVFSLLGVFLLLIAGINYVNLSIADFHKRSKEIGVRKVLGARKRQVALQVILETCVLCLVSFCLSVGAVYILFPKVAQILDANLTFRMLFQRQVLWIVVIITASLMVMSTLYPAWRLAANKPVNDFKALSSAGRKSSIGNILLLCQFTISVICICATFVVAQQIRFIGTKDPGYDRNNTIVLFMPDRYPEEKIPAIKNELATF
jgi:putative ABC transport system permease protein